MKTSRRLHRIALSIPVASVLSVLPAQARDFFSLEFSEADTLTSHRVEWRASTEALAGSGSFAPRLVSANRAGLYSQPIALMERGALAKRLNLAERFSYSFGAEALIDITKATPYRKWSEEENAFYFQDERPGWVRLQQLYAEVKYRGIFASLGMKENDRSLFDPLLGSGDLTLSNNARPIPQLRVGFIDFQDMPLTKGWVQIQGDIAYGKFFDNDWLKSHYNYYNSFITTGAWFHYKRCYFRTKPSEAFSVTVGMQHACQFGGSWTKYYEGRKGRTVSDKLTFTDFLKVFYQTKGNDSDNPGESVNFLGNHLGSWDVKMRYRFRNGSSLTAYLQKPWEDESGVAWQNGFDGVWGLRYETASQGPVEAVVVEYLDFTNQAGPMLWDVTEIMPNKATGADNYYNNFMYNGWANYGFAIGSPAFKAPIYNTDGYLCFTDNHLRGMHVGIKGSVVSGFSYRAVVSYLTANGTPYNPRRNHRSVTSMLAEAAYAPEKVPGLTLKASLSFDAGSLYRPAAGIFLSASYCGSFSLSRKNANR